MKKLFFLVIGLVAACTTTPNADYETKIEDAVTLIQGKAIFKKNCMSCHGENLDGLTGPNLIDERWKYGDGSVAAIMDSVTEGVEKNGMPAWKEKLSKEEIESVNVFVRSRQGSHL